MPRYIIRMNCEYSAVIDADDDADAERRAQLAVDEWNLDEDWYHAWSGVEVEKE